MAAQSRSVIGTIARLLGDEAVERQIAAAVVLAELRPRDPEVIEGLLKLLESNLPPVQRHALVALGAIGAKRILPALLPLLGARAEEVRAAAAEAVVAFGEEAVPAVRERLASAAPADRRPLEELLARLGGRDALSTLLGALGPEDLDGARAAVLPLRQRLRGGEPRERRRTLAEIGRFLGSKAAARSPAARLAAIKVLGFLEDQTAAPVLLRHAQSATETPAVREEAVIALRLSLGPPGKQAKAIEALVGLAEKGPLGVARAALYSLVGATLAPAHARRVARLTAHPEAARALIAIDLLGQIGGADAADALGRTLLETDERARAEAAAAALSKRPDAGAALARALCATEDRERAEMLARLLRPHLGAVDKADARRVVERAVARLEADHPTRESLLQLARTLDGPGTARALRALADKLRRAKKHDRALRVLRALGRSRDAAPDDGYALAALELSHGLRDEGLLIVGQLLERGYDVATAMRKDRSLDDRHRYEVGFHFVERGHPLGEELLSAVAASAGRNKLGQMARAKLKSAGF